MNKSEIGQGNELFFSQFMIVMTDSLTIFCCRVLNLEKKKETVKEKDVRNLARKSNTNNQAASDDDDEDDNDENFDEYIDWRAKKSYKKANKLI